MAIFTSFGLPLFAVNAAPLMEQVGPDYIIPTTKTSDSCAFNVRHGLELYAPSGSRVFKPSERVYFNLQLGDLGEGAGFLTLYNPANGANTPGGCLCDLATHLNHAAKQAGLLTDADQDGHEDSLGNIFGNPPKPWIVIWHVADYDPQNPSTKNANEKDFWIENQNAFSITMRWEDLPDGNIRVWWEKESGFGEVPSDGVDITQACVFFNPFRDGRSIKEHTIAAYHAVGDGAIPGIDAVGEIYPVFPASTLAGMGTESTPTYDPSFSGEAAPTSLLTTYVRLEGVGPCAGWVQDVFHLEFSEGLEKLQGQTISADQSLGVDSKNGVLPQFAAHLHISIGHRNTPAPGFESYKATLVNDAIGPVYWYDITAFENKQYVPQEGSKVVEEAPVTTIADFPFVVDVRDSQPTAANLVGVADLQGPVGIIWHQSATGPIDSTGQTIDGLRLCQIEKNRGDSRCGYHVVVGTEEIIVDGETYAVAQWLIDTDSQAWHAAEYNDNYLAIAFIDSVNSGPPTPAQLRTMHEITNAWVAQFGIDPDEVKGHKEVHPSRRGDPVGVDMSEVRAEVQASAQRVSQTGGTYYFSTLNNEAVTTDEKKPQWLNISWSPQLSRSQTMVWYLVIAAPLVIVLLLSITRNNLNRLSGKQSRSSEFYRRLNTFNALGLVVVAFGYVLMVFLYQPISHRPAVTYRVTGESVSATPPPTSLAPIVNAELDNAWSVVAAEAGYQNPALLKQFCVDYAFPRGADGRYLSAEQGGKVYPCEVAASIPKGETNTAEWQDPDPRQPGPWGKFSGWELAPEYFPRSPEEILQGFSISKMAQACRDGLEAVASNPQVQARYPGLTAQNMYTSRGCSIGRGQTLAIHFRQGGLLGDLENMDVWGSDEPAIEAIYRHLVARVSYVCGEQSWYHTGNVEVSLCSYNPNSWGVPEHAWYWDAIRAQAIDLRAAMQNHEGELASTGSYVQQHVSTSSSTPVKQEILVYSTPETVGSGVYAIWDTIPSLLYRQFSSLPDNSFTDWVEKSLFAIAKWAYSEETLINLGFIAERQEVNSLNVK